VADVLAGVACAVDDPGDCEAWIAPDGRFRIGTLAGAWAKPEAAYVGFAARAAARARRRAAVVESLAQLADELAALQSETDRLQRKDEQAAEEWRLAPADDALRQAHLVAAARAQDAQVARQRLAEADARYQDAELALNCTRQQLAADAADLGLPAAAAALPAVETAVDDFFETQSHLCQAASELRQALPELQRQRRIEQESLDDLRHSHGHAATALIESEEADARLTTLREAVGTKVDQLLRRQAQAKAAVDDGELRLKVANEDLRGQGEARAVAKEKADTVGALFERRSGERSEAVARFQRFAAAGLLLSAWPDAPLPGMDGGWTIDPALTLARRTEQALSDTRHDDDAWARVQKDVAGDYTELQRALSARGHQAQADSRWPSTRRSPSATSC
jgi:chromosome segregation ATPase